MTDTAFRREQRGVALRMAAAMVVAVAAIGAALALGLPATLGARLRMAIPVVLVMAAWLAAAIGYVARIRFFSPDDIAGGGKTEGSMRIRAAAAILQNTLEQVVLAIPVVLAVAITLDRAIAVLVVLGGLFTVGRVLFWHGYGRGATARAFGFALTFYPTVAALLVVVAATVTA